MPQSDKQQQGLSRPVHRRNQNPEVHQPERHSRRTQCAQNDGLLLAPRAPDYHHRVAQGQPVRVVQSEPRVAPEGRGLPLIHDRQVATCVIPDPECTGLDPLAAPGALRSQTRKCFGQVHIQM